MSTHLTVLIADDDGDDIQMLQSLLQEAVINTKFIIAANGAEVLHHLSSLADTDLPQLIVLDYEMPVLNGEQTLKALAGDCRFANITKVIWSTIPSRNMEFWKSYGARDWLAKPLDSRSCSELVKKLLNYLNIPFMLFASMITCS